MSKKLTSYSPLLLLLILLAAPTGPLYAQSPSTTTTTDSGTGSGITPDSVTGGDPTPPFPPPPTLQGASRLA